MACGLAQKRMNCMYSQVGAAAHRPVSLFTRNDARVQRDVERAHGIRCTSAEGLLLVMNFTAWRVNRLWRSDAGYSQGSQLVSFQMIRLSFRRVLVAESSLAVSFLGVLECSAFPIAARLSAKLTAAQRALYRID